MKTQKVEVKLHDGERFFAWVYLEDDQRLQDLLNDSRSFIPMNKNYIAHNSRDDKYRMTMVNKRDISLVHEI
jgi:hypothetical protein